jgi:hypothetical protein
VGREGSLIRVSSPSNSSGRGAAIGIRRARHLSQCTLVTGFIVPHIGQRNAVRSGSGSPHSLQKRLPLRLAVPHFGQVTITRSLRIRYGAVRWSRRLARQ